MIEFRDSTAQDQPQILAWTLADPYHGHQAEYSGPGWWLTNAAGSLLAFCLKDERGPLSYVRIDAEGEYIRIHIQFAPESEVSKRRLIAGLITGLRAIRKFYESFGVKGMIFNSVSPTLIAFMERQGFKSVGSDDYRLDFEG
jgi:hypothetical protein